VALSGLASVCALFWRSRSHSPHSGSDPDTSEVPDFDRESAATAPSEPSPRIGAIDLGGCSPARLLGPGGR